MIRINLVSLRSLRTGKKLIEAKQINFVHIKKYFYFLLRVPSRVLKKLNCFLSKQIGNSKKTVFFSKFIIFIQ